MGMVAQASNLEGCGEFVASLIYTARPCPKAKQNEGVLFVCKYKDIPMLPGYTYTEGGKAVSLKFNLRFFVLFVCLFALLLNPHPAASP